MVRAASEAPKSLAAKAPRLIALDSRYDDHLPIIVAQPAYTGDRKIAVAHLRSLRIPTGFDADGHISPGAHDTVSSCTNTYQHVTILVKIICRRKRPQHKA
jgi:hypothetical protein